MADKHPQLETSKDSLPSNEDLVNSIVTDFKNQYISNEDGDCKPNEKKEETPDSPTMKIPLGESNKVINENFDSEVEELEDDSVNEKEVEGLEDDSVNEIEAEKLEAGYTEEQKNAYRKEAETLKMKGNEMFKNEQFEDCRKIYTQALNICPLSFKKDRAILYANRAATKLKLGFKESAILDCSKAIELDGEYKKAYLRRAQTYCDLEKLDEALEDYKVLSKLNPFDRTMSDKCNELSVQITERNEKLKTEMFGQLKNLGNMILRPFGLSTNNFQMVQDPNTGGYSINFSQNTNN